MYHLDAYFWKPGWKATPDEEWNHLQGNLVKEEKWIIDGNYSRTLDIRMKRADVIILMDLSRWITVYRVIKRRVMYHGKSRPDLNKECPESLDFEFIKWVWNFRKIKIPGIMKKLKECGDKKIVVLKSPKEVKQLLEQIKMKGEGYFKEG